MALPIANAGSSPSPYTYAANPGSVVLNGSGTPGTGGSSITGYQWTILDEPDAITIDDATIAAPTIGNLPTEGSVLLFLVVTDNLSAVSEDDPLQAPDSAFYRISIKSQTIDIEKPAAGQRNFKSAYSDMVDKIDDFKADFDAHTIASHDTTATGAQLTTLTDGSSADSLHTHSAAAFSTLAASGVAGKIELASAPTDAGHPKAVTRLFWTYTGFVSTADASAMATDAQVLAFYVPMNVVIVNWFVTAADGWNGNFELHAMSQANWATPTYGAAISTLVLANDAASIYDIDSTGGSATMGQLLVVRKLATGSDPAAPTMGLTFTITVSVQY